MEIIQSTLPGSSSDSTITSAHHNPTLEAALGYHNRGYAVTPVTYREKEPYLPGWPKRRLTEPQIRQHFADHPGNIGIVLGSLSGGLADIDNDCPEAVALAAHLLPPTGCIFGRASNPSSHYVYKVANPGPRRAFTDGGDRGMLVEYRAKGCMTLFPGSVHPSGEPVEFVIDGEPAVVSSEELLRAVAKVAAASLIERNWVTKQRHDTALALGGTLARSDWPLDEAKQFVEAICRVAGDRELPDRLKAVEDAYEAVGAGKLAYGLPKLAELIGEETVTRIRPWLGLKGGDVALATPKAICVLPSGSMPWEEAPLSDSLNAAWFSELMRDRCRYSHDHAVWFVWNGSYWQRDSSERVIPLAQEAILRLSEVALSLPRKRQDELLVWMRASLSQARLQSMLRLAQPLCAIDSAKFDSDRWVLNCPNGVLDLRSGKLRPHSPDDLITKCVSVNYEPDAKCPTFLSFLDRIMNGDEELIGFLQRVLGYALTGSTEEQAFFIPYGEGANGKSTLFNLYRWIMGPYAVSAQADTFMTRKFEGIRSDLARLEGARMVVSNESEVNQKIAEGLVKQLSAGDAVVARELYKPEREYSPQLKLFMLTNHKPKVEGGDEATWRRIFPIPFTVTIPQEERDHKLLEKLQQEAQGEPPRVCRRLQLLRGWGHGQAAKQTEVFT